MQNKHSFDDAGQTDDAESTMRRNLGLDGSASSSANDPLKMARQAIRSQVTAREYTERQLAQAQTAIQDLRSRLRHVHQERETAVNAAHSATTAKDTAERSARAAESALATERATRVRTEGMLRDAQATIRDLREKLATANQNLRDVQAELAAERLARSSVDRAVIVAPEVATPTVRDCGSPVVRRPVGRPRKVAMVETVRTLITLSKKPLAIRDDAVSSVDAVGPTVRRPVGRPRKTMVIEPIQILTKPTVTKRANKAALNGHDQDNNEEPVQWWVSAIYDGKPFHLATMATYRFEDGRIAEDWGIPIRGEWRA